MAQKSHQGRAKLTKTTVKFKPNLEHEIVSEF